MCGICGFIGGGDQSHLAAMMQRMRHRGPDAAGTYASPDGRLHLGHLRLSILDLAGGGQPMYSADGSLVIVFNGEIYNNAPLRRELEGLGHVFRTDHSDTETLLCAYRQWGPELVHRLNGMWAFAIHDQAASRLFCSRDRFGKKPFFYSAAPGHFAFASELSALAAHPLVQTAPDHRAIQKYFAYGYIPAPRTFYAGAKKLPGGCSLTLDLARLEPVVRRYWSFELAPQDSDRPHFEEELCETLRHELQQAVARRLVADVPVGIFLSGGVDSSAVAAFATTATERVLTFSVGFEEASFDERDYARLVATRFQTTHHESILSIDAVRDIVPLVLEKMDEPMGDSSILPTYLLCRETRKHVTVALGGDGGDELFAGYDPFRALRLADLYSRMVPRPIHKAVVMACAALPTSHRNMSLDFRIKRTLRGLSYPRPLWNPAWLGPLAPQELKDLFTEPVDLDDVYSEAIDVWNACAGLDDVDQTLQFYTRLYLQDDILVKADRASMFNSLESRSPFLDIDFVNVVRTIPSRLKYRSGTTKYILKKALEPVLPHEIIYRPKKGFGMPVGKWFKDGVLTLDDGPTPPGLDAGFIRNRLAEHRAGRQDHRAFLWNLWLLQGMLRRAA